MTCIAAALHVYLGASNEVCNASRAPQPSHMLQQNSLLRTLNPECCTSLHSMALAFI